ncbi:MAG: HEAT repeat domain-containing protein [bacterium]|nr:HEAT repeat domain-containing protein [bacterium]
MAASDKLKKLVEKMPEAESGGTLTGPSWSSVAPIFDEVLKGGSENIVGIISMLSKTDDGKDIKPRYMIHAITTYACTPGKEKERACVAGAISSQLANQSKDNQSFLMGQLQLCGDAKSAPELGKYLCVKDISTPAAYALTAIGKEALPQLRAALPKAKGSCLLDVVQALGVLGDEKSVEGLMKAATNSDREIRITAVQGLANIGDAGSVDVLIKASDAKGTWERVQTARACLELAEKLTAAGKKSDAKKIYTHLQNTRKDASESYVGEIATKALAAN